MLETIPNDCDELWDHAANAIASLCTTLLLILSVERIVLGGGVMRRPCLLDKIRTRTAEQLNGYLPLRGTPNNNNNSTTIRDDEVPALQSIITTSPHGDDAGLVGAIVLAQRAWNEASTTTTAVEHDPDDATTRTTRFKQEAFKVGLVHGFLTGVIATALVLQYGFFGFGRSLKGRRY